MLSRRDFLWQLAASSIASPYAAAGLPQPSPATLSKADELLLDEICHTAFQYFWEAASPYTGLVKDRSRADGLDPRTVGSIAATGFGLTALCIGAQNGYEKRSKIEQRVLKTLEYLQGPALREKGFFYHFIDIHSGQRVWNSEVSSIDTALLLGGVLTCREFFQSDQISQLANQIYQRIDFAWLLNGGDTLSHGWRPETGFIKWRWDSYSELMLLYLLAIGSPSHAIKPSAWDAWKRPIHRYFGEEYISADAPLFIHQYSHAWVDFRGRRDKHADYFQNSIKATRAHVKFCLSLAGKFPKYSEKMWGITASDSARGYVVWGGPPPLGPIDGSVVPSAPAGSLPFLPESCLAVLRNIRENYGKRCWKRYGFVDAFNPNNDWTNPDVIGINVGISMLMAANLKSQFVWRNFMKSAEIVNAMKRVGFSQ
jgi:hypothetical protein